MGITGIEVVVASPEEAIDGVAEFWVNGELLGRTLVCDERTVLEIDPRPDGHAWSVDALSLHAALEEAAAKLAM